MNAFLSKLGFWGARTNPGLSLLELLTQRKLSSFFTSIKTRVTHIPPIFKLSADVYHPDTKKTTCGPLKKLAWGQQDGLAP